MLRTLALAALSMPPQGEPAAGTGWSEYWLAELDGLARAERSATLGPVGDRLWASRLRPEPGFAGQGHYLHHDPVLEDPLLVRFFDGRGQALSPRVRGQRWLPTHSETVYDIGGATVREDRWITRRDVFVSRFTVRGPADFEVRWTSPLAQRPGGDLQRFSPVPLAEIATVDLLSHPALRRGGDDAPVWVEGEAFLRQVGSRGRDRKAAASGGEVLGLDFGGAAGHEAAWRVLSTGVGEWTLLVRYARDRQGPAEFAVRVAGREVGRLSLAPTGGWGDVEEDFAFARLSLGALPEGLLELSLTALQDGANANIDGLLLVPSAAAGRPLPPMGQWPDLDPLRGGWLLPGGRADVDGVPFQLLPPGGPQGLGPDRELTIGGRGGRLHLLVLPAAGDGQRSMVACGGASYQVAPPGKRLADLRLSLAVPAAGDLRVELHGAVLVAATRETVPLEPREERRGAGRWHGVGSEVVATVQGVPPGGRLVVGAGAERRFFATLEFSGSSQPGSATAAALAGPDPLQAHRRAEAAWYARRAPRLRIADPGLARLWTYRWFLLRHNLARPAAGYLGGGPVVYEGRHGSWYPRVITFSTPHIVAEARWLGDAELALGNVRAHLQNQQSDGVLPNLLVDWRGFRYTQWIPEATVEACKVLGDRQALEALLPGLLANVEGNLERFDADGDGVLDPGDHYTTGMEFQPSFWFHQGYDNRQPQTDLERPDFTAYFYGNCRALQEACALLGRQEEAARMAALAERAKAGALEVLWQDEDGGFFYSVRASDNDPALCKEVIGFYPFRFRLPPDDPRYLSALRALVDPEQFWTPFPVATCSRKVPVFSAAVQSWPGPGGLVQPCMWNGPTWPHANSLVADAMAVALRHYHQDAITAADLGEFLRRYARFHFEGGDPDRPLLREYGDGESGENWGCADYMHSTFNDLLIRHLAGLVPRFDDVLEVRPLRLGLGDFAIEGIAYHGHHLDIAVRGEELTVAVDGEIAGRGPAAAGLVLRGVLP